MKRMVAVAALLLLVATPAWSADQQWFGAAGDRDWFNPDNWNADPAPPGPVPGPGDKAKVNKVWNNDGPIIAGGVATVDRLYVAETGGAIPGAQDVTVGAGGEFNSVLESVMGYGNTDDGKLIIDGGIANFQQHLFLGFNPGSTGRLHMVSGELNVAQMFGVSWNGGDGVVQLDGGTLHSEQFRFENVAGGSGAMDITGGLWIQKNFWVDAIQGLVDAGKITGYGDPANVRIDWHPDTAETHVYAVPEPTTGLLIGLALLVVRRR